MTPRQFLYLDRDLVRDFLAQLEGGVVDESREASSLSTKGGLGAEVGVGPVRGNAGRDKASHVEVEEVVRQTSASEFSRLYDLIDAEGLLVLDAVDGAADDLPLRRKDIVEVDLRLATAGLQQLADLIAQISSLAPMMKQFGADVDDETLGQMQAIGSLSRGDNALPVIGTLPGDAGYQIAMELLRDGLVREEQLEGEVTALVKIQRLLRTGDREVVGDPFGGVMGLIPEADRAAMLEHLHGGEVAAAGLGESEVRYPGAIATAIAIYR